MREQLEKEYPDYRDQIRSAFEAGQQHIFRWWDALSPFEKENLLRQVASIDFPFLHKLFHTYLQKPVSTFRGTLAPPYVISVPATPEERRSAERIYRIGESFLRRGEIAVLTVAGGDGTRLGGNGPKGTLHIAPISGKSIFQLHAEKICALQKRYGTVIPWYIMTSETNNKATQEFFASHDFFGLDPRHLCFFMQGMLPVLSLEGKLLMNSRSTIIKSPNGHGGSLIALKEKGILADMKRRGIRSLFYHQVDNVLIKIADPAFLGYHVSNAAEMSLKVVRKRQGGEKVGIVGYIDGRLQIVEYSELSQEDMEARDENGGLKYHAGNIAVHVMNIDFLEKVYQREDALPYHIARKKVPFLNEHGDLVLPEENNAIKYESFIFDILKHVEKATIVEALREDEFSPVKNMEGENSPETAKQDMINLFGRWLHNAGITIPVDARGNVIGLIEISPFFALDEEELRKKIPQTFQFDGLLHL
ncbi:MAG: UDPGP type 1 family protein [wastewater metagenome]|nr:UDPGP type 1 family protein [Candidatus Loosdrechtia aerotolerans]